MTLIYKPTIECFWWYRNRESCPGLVIHCHNKPKTQTAKSSPRKMDLWKLSIWMQLAFDKSEHRQVHQKSWQALTFERELIKVHNEDRRLLTSELVLAWRSLHQTHVLKVNLSSDEWQENKWLLETPPAAGSEQQDQFEQESPRRLHLPKDPSRWWESYPFVWSFYKSSRCSDQQNNPKFFAWLHSTATPLTVKSLN